jgi:hypothetical protein
MIKFAFFIVICALVVIFVEVRKISTRLDNLEEEQKRHNNIQSVILEQIDKIASHVGI